MRWLSRVSTAEDARAALEEICQGGLEGPFDLALVFCSPHHLYDGVLAEVRARLQPRVLIGCSGVGVIGGGREVESSPAISVTAASLPRVRLTPFHLEPDDLPSPDAGPGEWAAAIGVEPPVPGFILLSAPTHDPSRILEGLDFAFPGCAKVGGLASGGPAESLFLDGQVIGSGTIGVALQGDVVVDPLVAQGCRPIGPKLVVNKCDRNLLLELDGRRPAAVLAELYREMTDGDRELLDKRSLHLGVASSGLGERSDYLVRNVLGIDPMRGILVVGSLLRPGQTVRFHLRDATSAREDLTEQLTRYAADASGRPQAQAALLFTCAARGEGLYGETNHDSNAFKESVGDLPLGGLFCSGEIGPVGGETALLAYTSSFAIFRDPSEAPGQ